jgi:hypothetical protein
MNTRFSLIRKLRTAIILVAFPLLCTAQKGILNIRFVAMNNQDSLHLEKNEYRNELGQTYIVDNFKYYVSGIRLRKDGDNSYSDKGYYLIDVSETGTEDIMLKEIPEGDYSEISFVLGVDSVHNCSGAQSGALDPAKAMFWAWNTGYIFLKLEGKAAASQSPGHIFEYHIGGYKTPNNCIRTVKLILDKPLHIRKGENRTVFVKTDIAEILKTPVTIDFSKLSAVTDVHNATLIADNYQDMFSILHNESTK